MDGKGLHPGIRASLLGAIFFIVVFGIYSGISALGLRAHTNLGHLISALQAYRDGILFELAGLEAPAEKTADTDILRRLQDFPALNRDPEIAATFQGFALGHRLWSEGRGEGKAVFQAADRLALALQAMDDKINKAFDLALLFFNLLFSLGTAGSLWFYAQLHQSRLRQAQASLGFKQALEAEDRVRKRIAMELHDDIAQDIAAARMLCERRVHDGSENSLLMEKAASGLSMVNDKIKVLCTELRPPELEILGLQESIAALCEKISLQTDAPVSFIEHGTLPRLEAEKELAIFRIVREGLANAVKHGRSGSIRVEARAYPAKGGTEFRIEIRDSGYAEETESPRHAGLGWGIPAMRERAESIGVDLSVHIDSKGSSVVIAGKKN